MALVENNMCDDIIESMKIFIEEGFISKTPRIGDYISTEDRILTYKATKLGWYVSRVMDKKGDRYKVDYNDEWYKIDEFDTPFCSPNSNELIYPAIHVT